MKASPSTQPTGEAAYINLGTWGVLWSLVFCDLLKPLSSANSQRKAFRNSSLGSFAYDTVLVCAAAALFVLSDHPRVSFLRLVLSSKHADGGKVRADLADGLDDTVRISTARLLRVLGHGALTSTSLIQRSIENQMHTGKAGRSVALAQEAAGGW